MAYIITDGGSENQNKTANAARELRNSGVTVFAVGVSGANRTELELIASQKEYVYFCENFTQLQTIQEKFEQHTHRG